MTNLKRIVLVVGCILALISEAGSQVKLKRPRTIVTTDGEVDDQDTFIRFLLYANEFDIAGLVYSSSQWHYSGDGKGTSFVSEMPSTAERYGKRTELRWPGTDWMQEFIGQYAKVYPNLVQHNKRYPTAAALLKQVKVGNIIFEGDMSAPTEGSEWIKNVLLDEGKEPVYLQIWGGTNTVARALKSIEETYKGTPQWAAIYKKVSDKAVIYAVLDQDATYQKYVAPNWPAIKVIYNSNRFWCFAYPWPRVVPEALQHYLRGPWFSEHIVKDHGPLLEEYFLWGDGKLIAGDPEHTHGNLEEGKKYGFGKYDFISEGDSPAYFYLLDVGLRSMEDAGFGGWGGRFNVTPGNARRWEDGKASADMNPYTNKPDLSFSQTRWVDVLQNDFAARADWCVKPYSQANHAPVVSVKQSLNQKVKPGQLVRLDAVARDPDGNAVDFLWWQYQEAGSYPGKVEITNDKSTAATVKIPADVKTGQTIHIILQCTDKGSPALTRYRRIIFTV